MTYYQQEVKGHENHRAVGRHTLGKYRWLLPGNQRGDKKKTRGLHSAKIVLFSVDFDLIEKLQHSGDWAETGTILSNAARSIEAGGSDFLLICINTMHKVADVVEAYLVLKL